VAGSADLPLSNPVTMLFWRAVLAMVLVLDCVSWTACGISMEELHLMHPPNNAYQNCLTYGCYSLCVRPPPPRSYA
jgi:hypothetical protein